MKTENEIDLDNVISGGVVSNPFCFTQYCETGDENNRITHVEIKNIRGGIRLVSALICTLSQRKGKTGFSPSISAEEERVLRLVVTTTVSERTSR